jgi:hypothetical protein
MGKIAYTGVVLDEKSRSKLLGMLGNNIPAGWEKIAHHMTLNMGEIKPEWEKYLGMTVPLKVTHVGYNDKVMAVGVETSVPTQSKSPHITIAVNREAGGKPFMSNEIKKWKTIAFGLDLEGTVTEVPR